jgi:hypothetical protein
MTSVLARREHRLYPLALAMAWLAVAPLTQAEQTIVIHWKTTFDPASTDLLKDDAGNPLSQGTAVNQDGSLAVLGYFSASTSSNLFQGDFVPLTMGTTIGDSSYGSGMLEGMFSFTTKFVIGSQTVTVYPERPAAYDVNANHMILTDAPPINTLLAIRFYNQSTLSNSAKYNTVASPDWKWPGATSGIPQNKYFKVSGPSGSGNTSTSEYIYGNTFEDPAFPYQAAMAPSFELGVSAQGQGTVEPADVNGTYAYGTDVPITATPANQHYDFTAWNGSGVADLNASVTTVSMTEDRNVTALFEAKEYTLTILVDDPAEGNATGGGTFVYGTVPSISATPVTGYRFVNWSGAGVTDSGAASTTVTLDQNLIVTANFARLEYNLEVNATAGGGTVVTNPAPYYHFGVYDLNATPATGYSFSQWTGDVTDVTDINASHTTITMFADANVTAEFTMNSYLLMVNAGAGGTATGTGTFLHNANAPIVAIPLEGYEFTGWTGDVNGTITDLLDANTTIDMSVKGTNLTIAATFDLKEYALTVTANAGGDANGSGTFEHNSTVPVVATPLTGWSFDYWSGTISALDNDQNATATATITETTNLAANFKRNQYTLTVLAETGGDANGSGTFDFEDNRTITATPNPPEGYVFSHWSGQTANVVNVNAASTTVQILDSNVTVTANFTPLTYVVRLTVQGDANGTVGFQGDANGSLAVTAIYNYGAIVTIKAFPSGLDAGSPIRGYHLDRWDWSDGSSSGITSSDPYQFTITSDFNATATFLPTLPTDYRVTLVADPAEAGSLYVANGGGFDEDTAFPISVASINPGYTFLAWTSSEIESFAPGDYNSTATITLDENSTATAHFLQNQYFVDLSTSEGGTVSGGGSSYNYGASAEANATPDSIHVFDQWEIDKTIEYSASVGTKSHDANSSVYLINGQERPSLTFIHGFTYSFEVNGSQPFYFSTDPNGGGDYTSEFTSGVTNSSASGGGVITIEVNASTPSALYYYSGTTAGMGSPIQVVSLSDAAILPNPESTPKTITVVNDLSLQATFKLKSYDITFNDPVIGGHGEANASGPHEHYSYVTITAVADEGYQFASWSGSGVTDPASSTTTVHMTQSRNVTPNFEPKTYLLTLISSNSSDGSVRTSDNTYFFQHDTNATIIATPGRGFSFANWTGDTVDSNTSITTTVHMTGPKTVTANFEANLHNLTISRITRNFDGSSNANGSLGGSVSGSGALAHGTLAELVAISNPGYEFVEWNPVDTVSVDISVSNNAYFIKGQSRPTLVLVRGKIYTFNLDGTTTSGHPFYFSTSDAGGGATYSGIYTSGVTDSNVSSGTITFSPDASTPDTLYYYSGSTAGMGNSITVIDASELSLGQFNSTASNTFVTMEADRSYQAIFQRKGYTVTYAPYSASTGSVSFNTYDGTSSVEHGTTITATANPADGYQFISWSGEGLTPSQQVESSTLSLIITSNRTITANFAKVGQVTLTITVSPAGAGSAAGSGSYATINPAVPIYASANDSYDFVRWEGGDDQVHDPSSTSTTVNLVDDLALTAIFEFVPGRANEPKARPLEAVYSGWDWWQSDWFGFYWYVSGKNWVFHHELGWCYMVIQGDESVWIWVDFMKNWIWTNSTLYPFMFDHQSSEWIWYNREQSTSGEGNRIFYRYSVGDWEKH